MRTKRYVVPLAVLVPLAFAGAAAGVFGSPISAADTTLVNPNPLLPDCTGTGGSSAIGGTNTVCASAGNVQINDTPEVPEDLAYPWGYDDFVGAPFVFGGPFVGPHPDGGGGGGR